MVMACDVGSIGGARPGMKRRRSNSKVVTVGEARADEEGLKSEGEAAAEGAADGGTDSAVAWRDARSSERQTSKPGAGECRAEAEARLARDEVGEDGEELESAEALAHA